MDVRTYVIPGNPVPLARPRISRYNTLWDDQKAAKLAAGMVVRNQHNDSPYFNGPIELKMVFYLPLPKVERKKHPKLYHIFRPDLDNLIKFVCDIATDVLYQDDCIISSIEAKKVYDKNPRTVFTIIKL